MLTFCFVIQINANFCFIILTIKIKFQYSVPANLSFFPLLLQTEESPGGRPTQGRQDHRSMDSYRYVVVVVFVAVAG